MSLADRIKTLRGDISIAEFCRQTNIHRNTLPRYESGERLPDSDFLEAVCNSYNINPAWLLTGEGPMYNRQGKGVHRSPHEPEESQSCYIDENGETIIPQWKDPDPGMFDYIPMVKTTLSAGGGSFVLSEEIEGYYAFRNSWLNTVASNKRNLVLMRVTGDSMAPTIQARDTVLIDIGRKEIKEGEIYALRVDSTVMIKRLAFRLGGKVQIISDNRAEFESFEAELKDLHILGQVIFFARVFVPE